MKNRGITLIALVITIVVLMILAGVSIGVLKGDGGIIKQAGEAKIETEKSEIKEQIDIMTVQSIDKVGNIDREILKEKLEKLKEGKEIVETENIIYVIYPQYSFEINLSTGDVGEEIIEKITDETPWELSGVGTEENPYLIESIEDLVAFSNSVNSGKNYINEYVKLGRTLDFNSPLSYVNYKTKVSEKTNRIIEKDEDGVEIKTFLTSNTGFNPIGIDYTYAFRGVFDGNMCEIKNIYINRMEEQYVGLFGFTYARKIKNIGITGNVFGGEDVGSIAGRSQEVVYIENSYNKANVTGKRTVGGILGNMGNVINCYNVGHIKILGKPDVNSSADTAGGISGGRSSATNCYNTGTIELSKSSGFIGGIEGSTNEKVYKCVNIGNLITTDEKRASFMGGIIARSADIIEQCYNFGQISTENTNHNGGILGENNYTEVINCYYKRGTASGAIDGEDLEGQAEVCEESQMPSVIEVIQNQIEIDGQNMNVWKEDTNNINNGYPILYWQ